MSEELKPCRFCRADMDPIELYEGYFCKCSDGTFAIGCDCGAIGPSGTMKEAVELWNTRPTEDTLRAEVERITAIAEDYQLECAGLMADRDRLREALAGVIKLCEGKEIIGIGKQEYLEFAQAVLEELGK